jgi:hypothetical protein
LTWSLRAVGGACLVLAACHPAKQEPEQPVVSTRADSLVLERTRCYGACPAYRLSLHVDGCTMDEAGDASVSVHRMTVT